MLSKLLFYNRTIRRFFMAKMQANMAKNPASYYARYDSFKKRHYPEFQETIDIFKKIGPRLIKKDDRILNIGAGRVSRLEQFFAQAKIVYGLDPDRKALMANRRLTRKIVGVAENIPLPDNSVDLVILEWVLEHLQEPEKALSEISRVLAPGGKVIFAAPNLLNPIIFLLATVKKLSNYFSQRIVVRLLLDRERKDVYKAYYKINTRRRLIRTFQKFNFKIIGWQTTGCPGYFRFSLPLLWLALQWEKFSARPAMRWSQAYFVGVAEKMS